MGEKVHMQFMVLTQERVDRADRWAARSPEFGFTMYGYTKGDAESKVYEAARALVKSYTSKEGIEAFLKSRGVEYTIIDTTPPAWHEEPKVSMMIDLKRE